MTIQQRIKAAQAARAKNDTGGKEASQGPGANQTASQSAKGTISSDKPSDELVQLAYDALRSGTLPATTQFGKGNLPTGSASQRVSMLNDFAQLADDRKREALEAERRQLTLPGKVYNQETTGKNRARVQEIDQELNTLLPEKSGRLKSGLQSILATGAASFPVIADTFSQLNKNTGTRRDSSALDQLTKVNQQIRALENGRTGDALSYIRSQDQWKALDQQRQALNQQLQSILSTPVSLDAPGMQMMRRANQYREQALEGLEGVPRFLGETALSIGQNAALLPLAAVNPAAPLAAMGAISSADRMYELSERGLPASEALGRGLISGGIEIATEKLPLENLLDIIKTGGRGALRNILRQMGIEAGEESVSYLANYIADKAADDPEAAFSLSELAQAAAGGAISGGVFGTFGTAYNTLGQRSGTMDAIRANQTDPYFDAGSVQSAIDSVNRSFADRYGAYPETLSTGTSERQAQTPPAAAPTPVRTGAADRLSELAEETAREWTEAVFSQAKRKAAPEELTALSRRQETGDGAQEMTHRETAPTSSSAQTRTRDQADALIATLGENGQKAFRASYRSGSDLPSSFREFSKAYNQGLNGAKESAVEQGRYINTQAAYYAGQNDAAASLAREKRAAQFAPTAGEGSGLVYDDYVERTLDADTADKVNSVAKLLGVRVQFVDSVREGTANTQISGSDVLVEKDNPNPVMFLLGHEWTHRLQETAPVEYRKFRDLVSGEVSEEAAVLLEQYRRAGETISYEAALDEAAANYAGRMIEDGSVLDNFIQRNREDRTLLEKIRDAIRTLISKLTGAEKRRAQTAEGKLNSALDAAAKNVKKSDGENTKSPDAQTGDASTGTNMIEAYNGKSLSEDREIYNYEFLSKLPDMKITELPEISSVKGTDGKVSTRKVVEEGIKNARAVGVERDGKVYVKNGYTKREILISPGAIRHGLNGKLSRLLTNARLGSVIGNIVKNAVPINALQNKAGGVSGTYAMASYATDSQGREFVAIVTVEQRGGDISGIEVYDVTHAVSGRQKNASRADTKSQGVSPSTTGTISIKDLLNIVNTTHQSILSEDVLEHFGEARPSNGYYSQQAKFSLKGTEDAKSIAKMREENNLLRERVDDWKGQTRQTGQATTDKKAVARAARDLWAAYAGNKLPLDTKKEEPTCYDVRCQRFHRPHT